MKFYVAARFVKKEVVRELYKKIEGLGHEITVKWTEQESLKPYEENQGKVQECVDADIEGVRTADVVIVLSEVATDARGMYIELGIAMLSNILNGSPKIYALVEDGSYSAFYFHSSITRVSSLEEIPELMVVDDSN